MHIKRHLQLNLPKNQSAFLWGARKTGKSTYLRDVFPDSLEINLLQADVYQKYLRNPEKLREEIKALDTDRTIIIDEVQKVPLLLDEVHYLIETNPKLRFILCGSSVRKLKATGSNLLGGRAWRYLFQPLCYPELRELNWHKIFTNGLIPSHYLSEENHVERFLASYVYDYILPEVQYEAGLRRRDNFARFLDVIAVSNGEMISYSNISRECGVDAKTIRTYFEILEDMYLGYYLHPFAKKVKKQIITKVPKFYLFDVGIANYLKRFKFNEMIGSDVGKAFEHYVFLELIAYKNMNNERDDISYWRTKEGFEVDFIFKENAFEVKLSRNINKSHLKSLLHFKQEHDYKLHVICLEKQKRIIEVYGIEIVVWPVEEFLQQLWLGKIC